MVLRVFVSFDLLWRRNSTLSWCLRVVLNLPVLREGHLDLSSLTEKNSLQLILLREGL